MIDEGAFSTLCPPVGEVERLLDPIAVVDVDVDVQHTRVVFEQLQDGQHQVVDVAEARRLDRQVQSAIWSSEGSVLLAG